jgi:hypothetical protein
LAKSKWSFDLNGWFWSWSRSNEDEVMIWNKWILLLKGSK